MSNDKNPFADLSAAMADAVEKAAQSTLLVNARRRFPASGIAYAPDLVLTANHVVEIDQEIGILLPDGKQIAAQVAGRDPGSDLALLRLDEKLSQVAQVADVPARVGEFVLALGRPTPEGIEASLGVVSTVSGPVRTRHGGMLEGYLRTDAIPYPGFSGGPLVNARGEVLGLNTSGLSRESLLAIPAGIAWKVAQDLAEHGSLRRGYLGVRSQLVEIPPAARQALKREQETGLLLISLEEDSPALQASLMVGDIIVGIDGQPVADHDQLFGALSGDVVGKATPVEILRGGQPQTVQVTVAERPAPEYGRQHGGRGGHHGHPHHRHQR
jgi:S1-C subfamily serine protease